MAPSSCVPSDYNTVGCDVYKFAAVDIAGYLHHHKLLSPQADAVI